MAHNFVPEFFDHGSDIVVIGSNPEIADYDNPRGEIHGLRPYIRAVDARGNTKFKYSKDVHHVNVGDTEAEREARALAERLNEKLKQRRMPDLSRWEDGRAMYGSPAYEEYGQDEDLEWERSMEDEGY